jgi:hypothetical protein
MLGAIIASLLISFALDIEWPFIIISVVGFGIPILFVGTFVLARTFPPKLVLCNSKNDGGKQSPFDRRVSLHLTGKQSANRKAD